MNGGIGKAVLLALVLALPLAVFEMARREGARLEGEDLFAEQERQMVFLLDRTRSFAYEEFQLAEVLARFTRPLPATSTARAEELLRRREETLLRPLLPPHDLVVFRAGHPWFVRVLSRDAGLGLDRVVEAFWRVLSWRFYGSAVPTTPADDAAFAKALREKLGLACLVEWQRRQESALSVLRALEGPRILFWDRIFCRSDLSHAPFGVIALLDKASLDPAFPFRTQVRTWNWPEYGLVFLAGDGRPPLASAWFRRHPQILARLVAHPPRRNGRASAERLDDYLVTAGPEAGPGYRPVVVSSLADLRRGEARSDQAVFFLLLGLALVAFQVGVERFVFGRRVRIGVGPLLVGTFVVATLLPLTSARFLLERFLTETTRREEHLLAGNLSADLQRLDEGSRLEQASFTAWLRGFPTLPQVQQEILAARRAAPTLASFSIWLTERVNRAMPGGVSWGMVVDTTGTAAAVNPAREKMPLTLWKPNLLTRVMSRLSYEHLRRLDPRLPPPPWESPRKARAGPDRDSLEAELFLDNLNDLLGPSAYAILVFAPQRTFFYRSLGEVSGQMGTTLALEGRPAWFLRWFWRDLFQNEIYLGRVLPRSLGRIDGANLTWSGLGFRDAKRGFPFPRLAMEARFPRLYRQIQEAFRYSHSLRLKDLQAPGRPLVEISAAEYYVGMLVGQRSTGPLEERARLRRSAAYAGLAAGVVVAALLAWLGAAYFLGPLSELIRGVQAIRTGRFDARLDDGRGDEFGSLARVFNRLARGLQEGKVLERFVSSSVREAVRRGSSAVVDKTAETCVATVVFSALHGFAEWARGRPGSEVAGRLREHLEACRAAVARSGGEIDKMIGDKVMMVFRHAGFADDRAAVTAAVAVARAIRADLAAGSGAAPVIGLTTGTVISGILGAAEVRLDHTVIGDPVNLAARLCTLAHTTAGTRTVISGGSLRFLDPAAVPVEPLPFRHVKGKTQQITAFLLLEGGEEGRE
ncbi:MAG: HAMP domain-containing protein [Candidatus Riflebacteria bacterium]|nr:HAMP domain-containing protein [Candidatus Riflebacteria bacterium]